MKYKINHLLHSIKNKFYLNSNESVVKTTIYLLFQNFFQHNVSKNAAALAYYLLFALFPILIFISNLLGLLDLDISAIIDVLQQFLPKDIVELVQTYLDYVSENSNHAMLWFALVFSVWFPMRAVKGLMQDVRQAYHLGKPKRPIVYKIGQFEYTIVLLIVISLTLLLSILGEKVLLYISQLLPQRIFLLSTYLLGIWQYLRFALIAILMLTALGMLYEASLDKKQPMKQLLPGISMALISWLIVSIGFSFYVENFANYSFIYGTLGAVMVLLMWLYMTAVVLIMGAELNAILLDVNDSLKKGKTE